MSFLSRDFDHTAQAQQESVAGMLRRLAGLGLQVAALVLLSIFPFKFLHFAEVRPAFLLMAVYHWAVFSPQRLSPLAAFVAGFFLDLLAGGPLGMNALTLLCVQRITARQRKFLSAQPFPVLWMGFFLVAAMAFALQWAVISLFDFSLMDVRPMLFSAALTGLFYPPVAWVLSAFARTAPGRQSMS